MDGKVILKSILINGFGQYRLHESGSEEGPTPTSHKYSNEALYSIKRHRNSSTYKIPWHHNPQNNNLINFFSSYVPSRFSVTSIE